MLRKLVYVAAICGIAALTGCADTPQQQFRKVSEQNSPNGRLSVVDGPLKIGFNNMWVIRDKDTGREFIFVGGSDRVSICPVPEKVAK